MSNGDRVTNNTVENCDNTNMKEQEITKRQEIESIGNFLLKLYHGRIIGPHNDWSCKESDIQEEFQNYLTPALRQRFKDHMKNLYVLFSRSGFITNVTSNVYTFQYECILKFRSEKLKEHDQLRMKPIVRVTKKKDNTDVKLSETEAAAILKVDEYSHRYNLIYQGTREEILQSNFQPTNMSCYICREQFATMEDYEEHIEYHNITSEFKYLEEKLEKRQTSLFSLSYQLCTNSHHFCFTLNTPAGQGGEDQLVFDRIIIIQAHSMADIVYDEPLTKDGFVFYVDSHLFTRCWEQPIVLIFHNKDDKNRNFIEEHHIMVDHEYPRVHLAIKPNRLPSHLVFDSKLKLNSYFPPSNVYKCLKDNKNVEAIKTTSAALDEYVRNDRSLQPETIHDVLTALLRIEDVETIMQYLKLSLRNVKLRSFGDDYSFSIRRSNRSNTQYENILSIMDEILITNAHLRLDEISVNNLISKNSDDLEDLGIVVGRIQNLKYGRVSFKSDIKLDIHASYTVIFRPSRLQLRYQYRGLEGLPQAMLCLKKFLFPIEVSARQLALVPVMELYNKSIADNPEQLQAVCNIAQGPRNDAPYIIFGPPGTGKTTTLVESILQVFKREKSKILITASSNSACDEVALRLCKAFQDIDIPARAIVRVYSKSNEIRNETIDELLLEYSNMYSTHFYPSVEVLHEYRIVVCTMSIVAKLASGGFGRGTTFTHMFIDEVAASTECEAITAMSAILKQNSCLIIAGDHKQLGPVLQSKLAEELQLGVSLMERLLKYDCYRVSEVTGEYDRSIQTRLRKNFRSHPEIVDLYSGMYYDNELEARANIDDVSMTKHWHLAPNTNYPIIFHSVKGRSFSDKKSPSLYNPDELDVVLDYVKDLMYFGVNDKPLNQTDIGVISPYKKQYLNIRDELNLRRWHNIETGSVEIFQGKEKEVIITSFVRSGTDSLGFLESERRLNVTLSRAKSLLILIGNAETLSRNSDFQHIIEQCKQNGTFIEEVRTKADIDYPAQSKRLSRKELQAQCRFYRLRRLQQKEARKAIPDKENLTTNPKTLSLLKEQLSGSTKNIKTKETGVEINDNKRYRGRHGRRSNPSNIKHMKTSEALFNVDGGKYRTRCRRNSKKTQEDKENNKISTINPTNRPKTVQKNNQSVPNRSETKQKVATFVRERNNGTALKTSKNIKQSTKLHQVISQLNDLLLKPNP
ncbi:probable RNA helicase armi isoform X2 [Musca domestica]|uniref:Probable RNA helicase armi isoform X2 n=1 Tax=Musca domestica TaxID=7370 RepID=A0ABM3V546_MUSDO|nr:probable RNA helicase armi isoform X2 [Musca domestica]